MNCVDQFRIAYKGDSISLVSNQLDKLERQMREMNSNSDPLYEALVLTLRELLGALQEIQEIKKIISAHALS